MLHSWCLKIPMCAPSLFPDVVLVSSGCCPPQLHQTGDLMPGILSIYNPVIIMPMRGDESGTRSGQKPKKQVRNDRGYGTGHACMPWPTPEWSPSQQFEGALMGALLWRVRGRVSVGAETPDSSHSCFLFWGLSLKKGRKNATFLLNSPVLYFLFLGLLRCWDLQLVVLHPFNFVSLNHLSLLPLNYHLQYNFWANCSNYNSNETKH